MNAIVLVLMALVFGLGLAKKAEERNEKIVPFWEQMSLGGTKAIQWLKVEGSDGNFSPTHLEVETLLKGTLKYFFQHFEFEHTMKHMKNLTLETEILLLKCANLDRWLFIPKKGQKSAYNCMIKVLGIEWANENISRSDESKIYLDANGETDVMEVDFLEAANVVFTKVKEGTYYQFALMDLSD